MDIEEQLKQFVITTKSEKFFDKLKLDLIKEDVWPFTIATACCGVEYNTLFTKDYYKKTDNLEIEYFPPETSDLLIIGGTITYLYLPYLEKIYNEMPENKWVIALGSCAASGGPFKGSYSVVPGISSKIPVDVYIPGCPPTPDQIIEGLNQVKKRIEEKLGSNKIYNYEN